MKDINTKINESRIKNEFFIDRLGKRIGFSGDIEEEIISMHYAIAKLCFPELEYPGDYVLKQLGWVMVGSSVYKCPVTYKKLSEEQVAALKKLNIFHRLIFEYRGDNTDIMGYMLEYEKYCALCDD